MFEPGHLLDILSSYGKASGQLVNYSKSGISFSSNTPIRFRRLIARMLCIRNQGNPSKYLGLPVELGRAKKRAFDAIKQRISLKMQGWSASLLSQAGRGVLIKAVVQAIPAYTMSCFKLPLGWIKEVNARIARFWWDHTKDKKIHWLSWQKICKSKESGGVGFRDLQAFNLSLLAKQGWRILNQPETLWVRVLKAIYFAQSSFLDAKTGRHPSWVWRSLLAGRAILKLGTRWQIGDGDKVRATKDPWIPSLPQFKSVCRASLCVMGAEMFLFILEELQMSAVQYAIQFPQSLLLIGKEGEIEDGRVSVSGCSSAYTCVAESLTSGRGCSELDGGSSNGVNMIWFLSQPPAFAFAKQANLRLEGEQPLTTPLSCTPPICVELA
ncbi:hypothetical protein HHK36_001461 [Tetracentron sinense]|uniref:Reverse transcriptase n=1 Tax=Tetracentron sinense TaxID=13715 RepID=A0A834ZSW4_TETSI|nr:hypothetical protein HHK36_001461 [Tetracentron sinense]